MISNENQSVTKVGEAQIGIDLFGLSKILTEIAHERDEIQQSEYFNVVKITEVDDSRGMIILDCEIYRNLVN